MLPDAPETIGELGPYLVAVAVIATSVLWRTVVPALMGFGRWTMERFTRAEERQAKTVDALRADKGRLVREFARLEASNKTALEDLRALKSEEATAAIERLEGDQATISRILSDTPAEPEERTNG